MSITSQVDTLTRGLLIEHLLRDKPHRVVELGEAAGMERRAVERLLADLCKVGHWRKTRGMPWYEIVVEVSGRERYHRLLDYDAEPVPHPKRDSRR